MYSDSRKAQHTSFAHHRANLLFAKPPAAIGARKDAPGDRQATIGADATAAFKSRVRAGLLGFAHVAQAAV